MLVSSLKPTRQKLHKYFARSKSPCPDEIKDWNSVHRSSAIRMASVQTRTLGDPRMPISPVVHDSTYIPSLVSATIRNDLTQERKFEIHYEPEPLALGSFLGPPRQPPQQQQPSRPPQISQPDRLPPSPSAVKFSQPAEAASSFLGPPQPRIIRGPSVKKPRSISVTRRRAKTPVLKVGQLEMAAGRKRQEAAINRELSVRTIARQYRALIDDVEISDVPSIPAVHRRPLVDSASPHLHDVDNDHTPTPCRPARSPSRAEGRLEKPRALCEKTPWPESDAETLASSHDASPHINLLKPSFSPLPTPVVEDDDYIQSPDAGTSRFQIGFDMLARELSTAVADRSSRVGRDASGLQIWVMIEAYERLRDQVCSMETRDPELQCARAMFDSWLAALRAIHKTIVGEGAESESEYGDEGD
ncbi:uncharacterized protein MAM_02735 [Metarhizium album ARSEF 1941]|uniref:Mating-type switching protein swi10 n=1 Tax=Metarhizium album (strain ARSEF 1941) TaxID=1081103 RepID=A0A0B2X026_METAS|nr:uncharacterized protein MAM_02735 [Metarhizium album ARSEF 1941]KHN99037.1 hypothetical protein MAM_02735 [Metarhizium album ARSEF 1941]